jgi:catechol 2,3-dioxygenase-like lactoylglutathione lyase family enzyme
MRSFLDAKAMARALRAEFDRRGVALAHSEALELVARQFGCGNWNELAAKIAAEPGEADRDAAAAIGFTRTAPILRIFDEARAAEFYEGFLGFARDWEHRFGDNFPLYAQVSRAGLILHLSGHHGDATPGSTVFVTMTGIRGFHAELSARNYRHNKPVVAQEPWGLVMEVVDPFGNRIRFCEQPQA